jgi:hypothetical protein
MTSQAMKHWFEVMKLVSVLVKIWKVYNIDEIGFNCGVEECFQAVTNTSIFFMGYWAHLGQKE